MTQSSTNATAPTSTIHPTSTTMHPHPPASQIYEVGWMFVREYYRFLNNEPGRLHCFYAKDSMAQHGFEGESITASCSQQGIYHLFEKLKYENCRVFVSNVDSQPSRDGGVLVQVLGEMSNNGQPSRKFVQTFFLAKQPKGYYILNDILRFLEEEPESEVETDESNLHPTPSFTKSTHPTSASVSEQSTPYSTTTPMAASTSSLHTSEARGSDAMANTQGTKVTALETMESAMPQPLDSSTTTKSTSMSPKLTPQSTASSMSSTSSTTATTTGTPRHPSPKRSTKSKSPSPKRSASSESTTNVTSQGSTTVAPVTTSTTSTVPSASNVPEKPKEPTVPAKPTSWAAVVQTQVIHANASSGAKSTSSTTTPRTSSPGALTSPSQSSSSSNATSSVPASTSSSNPTSSHPRHFRYSDSTSQQGASTSSRSSHSNPMTSGGSSSGSSSGHSNYHYRRDGNLDYNASVYIRFRNNRSVKEQDIMDAFQSTGVTFRKIEIANSGAVCYLASPTEAQSLIGKVVLKRTANVSGGASSSSSSSAPVIGLASEHSNPQEIEFSVEGRIKRDMMGNSNNSGGSGYYSSKSNPSSSSSSSYHRSNSGRMDRGGNTNPTNPTNTNSSMNSGAGTGNGPSMSSGNPSSHHGYEGRSSRHHGGNRPNRTNSNGNMSSTNTNSGHTGSSSSSSSSSSGYSSHGSGNSMMNR